MIEKIIEYSIRNRFVVILLALAVTVGGVYAVVNTPVDAIPDLSENQVIVFTDWMGRSPRDIEDQITYPLSVNLQGLAGVKAVRSSSEENFSMINVIFDDKVDFYFARERVLERLALASTFLPQGVVPYMAPDATALGQIFWYTVEGKGYDLGRLRAIQDWYVRYQLNAVPGVAQVASVGGYPIEYQIDVDPHKLRSYGVTLGELYAAVARSNSSVGGRVIHKGNTEYLIRSVGWIRSPADIEQVVVRSDPARGTPILVSNLATVGLGTQFRRSVLEKDGSEAVGGVVMMRYGENPLAVTKAVKEKIAALHAGLPPGVRIVPFYDRTRLIEGAVHTLGEILAHEMIIASLAILLILMHFRSAFVICLTLPLAVLVSFILMRLLGIASNIMSLAGIAISIGVLVDQAIVMVENATHQLTAHFGKSPVRGDTRELVIPACKTVGRPIFFSVMIILLSFIPVFALTGLEGKTFHPLAFTKSFAMIGVAILSITLVPALIPTFLRGRLRSEEESWLVRSLIAIYRPMLTWMLPRRNLAMWSFSALLIVGAGLFPMDAVLPFSWHACFLGVTAVTIAVSVILIVGRRWQVLSFLTLAALALGAYSFPKIGKEYMPPLDEGSILDMPVTVPRASVAEVADDIKARDALLRRFPEVEMVVGKAGRAETPTDPAPLEMLETVIDLRPKEDWPKRNLRYGDARRQTAVVLEKLAGRKLLELPAAAADRDALVNAATMAALGRLDAVLRALAMARNGELEAEFSRMRDLSQERRRALWQERLRGLNYELLDQAPGAYDWYCLDALRAAAKEQGLWTGPAKTAEADAALKQLRAELDGPFARGLLLWQKSKGELLEEMDSVVQMPGWGNIWTQPIINRIDMLATGVRTPIGVKVFGDDLEKIKRVSEEVAAVLRQVPGAVGVTPDQNMGKGYVEIVPDRRRAARYGINVGDIQDVIEVALGGKPITMTVEGRERFPVRIRYARHWREDEEQVKNLLVSGAARGVQVPLSMVADVRVVEGPSMINSENGMLRSYVQLDVRDRDLVGFVEDAQRAVAGQVKLPQGMFLEWSGQFEHQLHAKRTLLVVLPLVLLLIFIILYLTYSDLMDAALMMMAVPEALVGGVFFLWLLDTWLGGYNFSVAVQVGFIACFGMATETGIIMLVYLRQAIEHRGGLEKIASLAELRQAVLDGAVHRLRPKLLTEGVAIIALAPMLFAGGVGHEVLNRMAAPVLGGLLIADEVVDIFIPVRFYWVRRGRWLKLHKTSLPEES
ncbi:MAG: efflux RND transporter permease subunit [Thermoguttaceae bacterium]